jgi:hypothetical protein
LGWVSDTNAIINRTNGVFEWTPAVAFASSTNWFEILATDDGSPSLTATQLLTVLVNDYLAIGLGGTVVRAQDSTNVPLVIYSSAGVADLSFDLIVPEGHLTNLSWFDLSPKMLSITHQPPKP